MSQLPMCLCAYQLVRLCAYVPMCLCAYVPMCLCAYVPMCLCAYVPMGLCACVPVCLCAYVPIQSSGPQLVIRMADGRGPSLYAYVPIFASSAWESNSTSDWITANSPCPIGHGRN